MTAQARSELTPRAATGQTHGKAMGRALAVWVALLAALSGGRLAAELYRVELAGGTAFETRYLPVEEPETPHRVFLLTDAGNWVALPRSEVVAVRVEVESRGFGRLLDAQTVAVGMALNDQPRLASEPSSADPLATLAGLLARRFDSLPAVTVEQFVEPEASEGIPLPYAREAIPPVGEALRFVTPQERP